MSPTPGGSLMVRRALARTLDFVLLSIVNAIAWMAFALLGVMLGEPEPGAGLFIVMVAVCLTVLNMGYFVVFELASGRSLGKLVMGLEVRRTDGASVTLKGASVRNLFVGVCSFAFALYPPAGMLLAIAAVIAIAVSMRSSQHEQGLHDRMADTVVRRAASPRGVPA